MCITSLFTSPLEQFQILPLIPVVFGVFDLSITNQTIILVLVFFFSLVFFNAVVDPKDNTFPLIPSRWQSFLELAYRMMLSLVVDNIKDKQGGYFFPLVFTVFFVILSLNLIGLIPYSFTVTSHLLVTFGLALAIFIGINIVCIRIHGIHFFALFLPPGTSLALALLLVPIDLISYIFKPISLSVRVFANMMAGHTLLKVIAGFAYTMMGGAGILFLMHYIPLLILLPIFGLELAVALIQSFVFSILICIYLNDAINLH